MEHIVSSTENEDSALSLDLDTYFYTAPASVGLRFVNLLVDTIVIYFCNFGFLFCLGFANHFWGSSFISDLYTNQFSLVLLEISIALLYYVLFEGLSGGRTIGKFCTRTKVVLIEGEGPISAKDAFLRTLCRYVPFEAFSAFSGFPWHDKWTHTKVVKITDPYTP